MRLERAAKALRAFAGALERELQRAEEENLQDLFDTSGTYSAQNVPLSELERLNRPYGLGPETPSGEPRGALPMPPQFISARENEVLRSWEQEGPSRRGGDLEGAIYNSSQVAVWLQNGTPTMRARPLDEAVEKDCAKRIEQRRDQAFDRAGKELRK